MKTFRLTAPEELTAANIPSPSLEALAPREILVKVAAAGICGSDLPAYRGKFSLSGRPELFKEGKGAYGYPLHEIVGEVVESRHPTIRIGDVVVGWASSAQGLSELVVTAGDSVVPYYGNLPPHELVIAQPLACVLHTINAIIPVQGLSVAVIGLGSIGLLFTHVLKRRGARHVSGVDPVERSDAAAAFGIDKVYRLMSDQWATQLEPGQRPEIIIECVGHQTSTMQDSLNAVAAGGTVFYFGVPDDTHYSISLELLFRKNLKLQSGWVPPAARARALQASLDYLIEYPTLASNLVTDRYPFRHADKAFQVAANPRADQHKVVLDYSSIDEPILNNRA